MPHLINVWPSVSRRLNSAGQVLLLFDYDGTLAPIVERPEAAAMPPRVRELLAGLSSSDKYLTGIVTGRSLRDVSARVGLTGLLYAGNHGLEIRGPGLDFVHEAAAGLALVQEPIAEALRKETSEIPGVIVEPKGLSLSMHYRMTPAPLVKRAENAFASAVAPFVTSGTVKVTSGKQVLEVRPNVEWDKGKAIAKLQETYPEASLTLFFGDDVTDEDGFRVVQGTGGIAVLVGPARQPTVALHRVDSPEGVQEFLELLSDL